MDVTTLKLKALIYVFIIFIPPITYSEEAETYISTNSSGDFYKPYEIGSFKYYYPSKKTGMSISKIKDMGRSTTGLTFISSVEFGRDAGIDLSIGLMAIGYDECKGCDYKYSLGLYPELGLFYKYESIKVRLFIRNYVFAKSETDNPLISGLSIGVLF
ncbi:hypothetical protein KO519_16300 [Paraglaciecola agarilytica]|uniref:hypothetical protein n=1 Tax=Paraglaciecola chathamensis TaxID=368405 RepID=UPI001C08C555|nr:hypothetical protein [Paraglaciecola agarilytica]MBU3019242.1 hypothetical protein [Paraglaciecola agarilytica]